MEQVIEHRGIGLARLSAFELRIVHAFVLTARPPPLRLLAVALSWLGNGWAYIAIAVAGLATSGLRALVAVTAAALNAALLHCLYPSVKRIVARPRPYRRDINLEPLLRVLDEYSFPSGHAMTLSAALVPFVLVFPRLLVSAIAMSVLMAWARLASAHHYPSDVAAGALLGVGVSYPVSHYALAALRLVS